MSRAEYMRKYRKSKSPVTPVTRKSVTPDHPPEIVTPVTSIWHPEIDQSRFDGHGRGVVVDGYVLISLGAVPDGRPECGVVDVDTWRARLDKVCAHGLAGWSCKPCLPV